ncbi:MAG: GNAT family N-acetyltransferase [Clostridia bacterium]|nr:GNAT family N-acetyltransferase [Clostridia bacterium]
MKIRYKETTDGKLLLSIFEENEIEVAKDEFSDGITSLVKGFAAYDEDEDNRLVGAVALATRMEKDIINGIAVDPNYRRNKIAENLLKLVMDEALEQGVQTIWIVARAPAFFEAQGFEYITEQEVPNGLFDCPQCPQYNKVCFPKLMKYDF